MQRYTVFALVAAATVLCAVFAGVHDAFVAGIFVFGALTALGVWDVIQPTHSLLRNYPVIGHMRWVFEGVRPEIRQYLLESDRDEVPFSREKRSIVYQRAKGVED